MNMMTIILTPFRNIRNHYWQACYKTKKIQSAFLNKIHAYKVLKTCLLIIYFGTFVAADPSIPFSFKLFTAFFLHFFIKSLIDCWTKKLLFTSRIQRSLIYSMSKLEAHQAAVMRNFKQWQWVKTLVIGICVKLLLYKNILQYPV